ncbi:MAG: heavy metal-binding domain-containing protein [Vicinamibacterales bacterium]
MTRRWIVRYIVVALLAAGTWAIWPRVILSHNPTTTTVLFNREIVALLQNKCLQCHGDGRMAMSLATYADARPWAVAIKEEVLARRMPPWPAEAGYGGFANDIGLTTREMDFLLSWVEGGAPEGADDPPPFIDHSGHWMLGEPQATVVARQGVVVNANSAAQFTRIVLDPGLDREAWIRAVDFKPGDPRVARAAFFTVVETGEYLGGWTPWHSSTELPAGVAFRLPARARIAVDVLYRGIDERVVDTPRLALYVAAERPLRRASTALLRASAPRPVSSRGGSSEAGLRLTGRLALPTATTLFALRPQVQDGGTSLEVTAVRPDGSRDVLLRVRRFRSEWQAPFVFRQPVALPAGSVLEAAVHYDETPAGTPAPSFTVAVTRYDEPAARLALMPAHQPQPSLSPAAQQESGGTTAWFCPMHPDVTSAETGNCRKCGMRLVAGRPFDTRNYSIDFQSTPTAVKSGAPFRMRFDVRHPSSGALVRDFELVHDKRYHLFVVSHDMTVFQHLHPEQQPDGAWVLEAMLPKPGAYRVVSDFLPTGGAPQLLTRTIITAGFDGDLRSQDARLEPDTVSRKTEGPITAELRFDPPRLVAGEYGHLEFTLTDSKTGEPVADLQPYLGAFGHAFILSEDLRDSVHSHPPEWRDGKEISSGLGGPTVLFEGYMPRPGRYRVWSQFLRRGELTTIPFTFEVSTLDEVLRRR